MKLSVEVLEVMSDGMIKLDRVMIGCQSDDIEHFLLRQLLTCSLQTHSAVIFALDRCEVSIIMFTLHANEYFAIINFISMGDGTEVMTEVNNVNISCTVSYPGWFNTYSQVCINV